MLFLRGGGTIQRREELKRMHASDEENNAHNNGVKAFVQRGCFWR